MTTRRVDLVSRLETSLPPELRSGKWWLLWKLEHDAKKPYYVEGAKRNGKLDSEQDRARLVSFAEAVEAYRSSKRYAGLGVALGDYGDRVLSGIDLDDCIEDGKPAPRAQQIIDEAASYAEISPSGEGVKIFGFGDIGTRGGAHGDGLEIYSHGRFFTVTGETLNGARLADLTKAAGVARRLFAGAGTVHVDFSAAREIPDGRRNSTLASIAGRLRRDGLTGDEIAAALQQVNLNRCKPPLTADEVDTIARSIGRYETDADQGEPLALLGFSAGDVLRPIREETYLLPGLVPTDAYTLIAGALSSYKSTLLHNLIVWRATGHDLLALGVDLGPKEIGPCVLASYEDTDWRIFARLQRVLQNGHRIILAGQGREAASEFLARAAKNIKRVPLSGRFGRSLVSREKGVISPNAEFLDELLAAVRAYTSEGVLLGIDPLRLAVVGSQNDDDGADIVVHVLNWIPGELAGSGVIVCSHTTKQGAKEPGVGGYAEASYATSGSALYSQHARSNFLMTRLKPDDVRDLFDPAEVAVEDSGRQVVAKLTHGRLSHGPETEEAYFRMQRDGVLIPVRPRAARTAADINDHALPFVAAAIERLVAAGLPVSTTALESDTALTSGVGGRNHVRAAIHMLEEAGHLAFTGTTRNRRGELTAAGRARLDELRGANWRE